MMQTYILNDEGTALDAVNYCEEVAAHKGAEIGVELRLHVSPEVHMTVSVAIATPVRSDVPPASGEPATAAVDWEHGHSWVRDPAVPANEVYAMPANTTMPLKAALRPAWYRQHAVLRFAGFPVHPTAEGLRDAV
jgi:hypothetical protein